MQFRLTVTQSWPTSVDREFQSLAYLFERILTVPASSAPVERIFSKSGLIARPHRAKMSDKLLESLVFAKCSLK